MTAFVLKPGRIRCEVLGCRRTASAEKYGPTTRIVCGKCWRLGSRGQRKAYTAAARDLRRLAEGTPQYLAAELAGHLAWEAVVREATEAKAGLS